LIYKTIEEERVMKELDVLSEITELEVPNGKNQSSKQEAQNKVKRMQSLV
jgi:hypothetical protein